MKKLTLSAALLALVLPLAANTVDAQTATLLRDINTTNDDGPGSFGSGPEYFAVLGERAVFRAGDGSTGEELWVTDGTSTGTRILEDICPGTCSSGPYPLGVVNGVALLLANPEQDRHIWHLWRSDGTEAGTYPLDIPFSFEHPLERQRPSIAFANGVMYFGDCSEERGCELWRSDGTPAGTRAVKVLVEPSFFSSYFSQLVAAGNRLYFAVSANESSLWTSDGTEAGTLSILEPSSPRLMAGTADGRLLFTQGSEEDGEELWASNGTRAGTRALTRFEAPEPFEDVTWMKPYGNRVYFLANDVIHGREIWRSDGTEKGTVRVTEFGVYEPFGGWSQIDQYRELLAEAAGGRLVFVASDGLTPARLWVTDGRPESTAPLDCGGCRRNGSLVAAGGKVFFFATEPDHGSELWVTDGTAQGTRITRDICAGWQCGGSILGERQGGVYFYAADSAHGREIWFSDSTADGTRRLTDMPGSFGPSAQVGWSGNRLYHGGSDGLGGAELWVSENGASRPVADITRKAPSSRPRELAPFGDRLVFTACDGQTRHAWISAGTPESTAALPGLPADFCASFHSDGSSLTPVEAGGRLFYVYLDQLWSMDGNGAAAQLTHVGKSQYLVPGRAAVLQGKLFFLVYTGDRTEVWKSDGTPQGTVKAFELPSTIPEVYALTAVGNELYFGAYEADGDDVWRSDGTQEGTRRLTTGIRPRREPEFTRAGSSVFFMMEPDFPERELWKSDGTPAGTVRVAGIPGGQYVEPSELTEHQGKLYFFALADEGWSLWTSNGTEAGTVPLRSFHVEFNPLEPPRFLLTSFAGRLFFVADDGEHGVELWTSDGTAAGTNMLLDLYPGAASSRPTELTVAGGRLFFAADDGERGHELWQSDGTVAGTRLAHDLAPEDSSSYPGQLTATSTHLYFTADDGLSGRELWSLPLASGSCQPSPRHLCLGGRYRVEATWKDFQGNIGSGTAVAVTGDTGYFWFFSPTNVEVILKVLDGTGLNGHRWVFYGALSSVEYTLTVTDTQTGLSRRYFNPMSQLASVGDTTGFGPLGAYSRTEIAEPAPAVLAEEKTVAVGTCEPTPERLCLNGGRFAVEVAWKDFQGNQGKGKAVNLTADTGYFWFFDQANVEVVLKVLDGTALNGKHWVFYGALSSVEYTITVTDTQTGAQKTYKNPSGRLASVADTGAF